MTTTRDLQRVFDGSQADDGQANVSKRVEGIALRVRNGTPTSSSTAFRFLVMVTKTVCGNTTTMG